MQTICNQFPELPTLDTINQVFTKSQATLTRATREYLDAIHDAQKQTLDQNETLVEAGMSPEKTPSQTVSSMKSQMETFQNLGHKIAEINQSIMTELGSRMTEVQDAPPARRSNK